MIPTVFDRLRIELLRPDYARDEANKPCCNRDLGVHRNVCKLLEVLDVPGKAIGAGGERMFT